MWPATIREPGDERGSISHQYVGRPSTSIQDSSCFELWADLGPLAIVKDQISNAVVEGHMIATCHATRCMATLAVQGLATEAAGPTSTHIDSQATSYCSKKIRLDKVVSSVNEGVSPSTVAGTGRHCQRGRTMLLAQLFQAACSIRSG